MPHPSFTHSILGAALALALSPSLLAQDAARARTEDQARRVASRLETLHREADRLAGEARTLLGDLRQLELTRQIASEELTQIAVDAAAVNADLAGLDADAKRLEAEDRAAVPALERRLVDLYKLGQGGYARLLLGADLRQLGQASRTVAMLAATDRDRVETRRVRLLELGETRTRLEARRAELAALKAKAEQSHAAAARVVQARNTLLRQIDSQRDLTAQLAGELQVAQESLQRTLRTSISSSSAGVTAIPMAAFRGALQWPVSGAVRRRFGSRPLRQPTASPLSGVEIAADEGTAVRPVHDGTVIFADTFTGFGKLVVVQHDPERVSLYGYLLDVTTTKGDRVSPQDVIGNVGHSPAGAAGLYFELRVDATPVDPLQWLKSR